MELWPFIPQRGLTESLEWLTDVIRCKAGEDRVPLRHLPRQTYFFRCHLTPEEYGYAKVFARQNSQEFYFPMWQHCRNMTGLIWGATSIAGVFDQRFYTGPLLIWDNPTRWEIRTITVNTGSALTLDSELTRTYLDPVIAPIQVVRWAQSPDFTVSNNDVKIAELLVKAIGAVELTPATVLPKHRGVDVLQSPNILVSDLREQHYREVDEIDNGAGIIAASEKYSTPETKSKMAWHPIDRQELIQALEWIHTRRGRYSPFWYKSHNRDLVPRSNLAANTDPLAPGTDLVEVTRVPGLAAPCDVAITHTDGSERYYRVQGVVDVTLDKQALLLTGNAGTAWPLANIARISFLVGVRFDADRVEIRYGQGGAATIAVPITEVPGL